MRASGVSKDEVSGLEPCRRESNEQVKKRYWSYDTHAPSSALFTMPSRAEAIEAVAAEPEVAKV